MTNGWTNDYLKKYVEDLYLHPENTDNGNGIDLHEIRRIIERVAEEAAQKERKKGCTCGSGGHPRKCEKHPTVYHYHIQELNLINEVEELREQIKELREQRDELAKAIIDVEFAIECEHNNCGICPWCTLAKTEQSVGDRHGACPPKYIICPVTKACSYLEIEER